MVDDSQAMQTFHDGDVLGARIVHDMDFEPQAMVN